MHGFVSLLFISEHLVDIHHSKDTFDNRVQPEIQG